MLVFFVIVMGNLVFNGVDLEIDIFLIFFVKIGLWLLMFNIFIFVGRGSIIVFFEIFIWIWNVLLLFLRDKFLWFNLVVVWIIFVVLLILNDVCRDFWNWNWSFFFKFLFLDNVLIMWFLDMFFMKVFLFCFLKIWNFIMLVDV